ncbi:MAG TPA: hypothetical protein VK705_12055 [Ferruginibacter sp.]|jgi:hypothetical protein|nr:hypothetical protein [Ferruginibacter sp.]
MNRSIYLAIAFIAYIFIMSSCNEHSNNVPAKFSEDLFAAKDTSLFHPAIQKNNKSGDSAFQQSTLVAACKIISIDSMMHDEEKAPFYLVAASIDTLLKGDTSFKEKLYFISYQRPAFNDKNSEWLVFLSKIQNAKLFGYSNVEWQYLDNAPFIKYAPSDTLLNDLYSKDTIPAK